jgi:hypothetical protein
MPIASKFEALDRTFGYKVERYPNPSRVHASPENSKMGIYISSLLLILY